MKLIPWKSWNPPTVHASAPMVNPDSTIARMRAVMFPTTERRRSLQAIKKLLGERLELPAWWKRILQ